MRSKIIVVSYTIPFAVVPIFSHSQIDDGIYYIKNVGWCNAQICEKYELELLLPPPSLLSPVA